MIKATHNPPQYCRKPHNPPRKEPSPKTKSRRPAGTPEGWRLFLICPLQPRKNPPHPAGSHPCRTGRALVSVHSGGSATPRRTPPPAS